MAYTMSDGIVRRVDDPDLARPALASETWAFEEIERLRAALETLYKIAGKSGIVVWLDEDTSLEMFLNKTLKQATSDEQDGNGNGPAGNT